MEVTQQVIQKGIVALGLRDKDVAVHSSLKSFGHVANGAETVLNALLSVCGTVLMPTFCDIGQTNPPANDRPAQNGWDYGDYQIDTSNIIPFDPVAFDRTSELNVGEMGSIPAALLRIADTVRSKHLSVSWAANGPGADWYTADHAYDEPNLPLKKLLERSGHVLLLGVGLSKCTAIHLAEEMAGRRPFIRWVLCSDGKEHRVREYGCSDGFDKLAPFVRHHAFEGAIGDCRAVSYPLEELVNSVVKAITAKPEITLCDNVECIRCQDSLRGGPLE